MLTLFHLGITAFMAILVGLPIFSSMLGAILPDIIDKVLFFLGIAPYGRFFAHSIFFGPLIAIIVFLLTRKKYLALSILFGCYLHLLVDITYFLPMFYPVVKYEFPSKSFEMDSWWFMILTESIGVAILYSSIMFKSEILYYRNKVFVWMKKMTNYSKCMKRKRKK